MLPNFNSQTFAALEDSSSPRREYMCICTYVCMRKVCAYISMQELLFVYSHTKCTRTTLLRLREFVCEKLYAYF